MAAITYPRRAPARALTAAWSHVSFGVLLAATFVLYTTGLDRNGWANPYYAAAAHAAGAIKVWASGLLSAPN